MWGYVYNFPFFLPNFEVSFPYSAKGPLNKNLNLIFPTKYVIPKSLKVSHWLSEFQLEPFFRVSWQASKTARQGVIDRQKPETQTHLDALNSLQHFLGSGRRCDDVGKMQEIYPP